MRVMPDGGRRRLAAAQIAALVHLEEHDSVHEFPLLVSSLRAAIAGVTDEVHQLRNLACRFCPCATAFRRLDSSSTVVKGASSE